MSKYNKRIWLNPETSHFTGALVCHDGIVKNQGRPAERYTFVEISSCTAKIKLHSDKNAENEVIELKDFISKLNTVTSALLEFQRYLFNEMQLAEERLQIQEEIKNEE
jgi:hypothetical protein